METQQYLADTKERAMRNLVIGGGAGAAAVALLWALSPAPEPPAPETRIVYRDIKPDNAVHVAALEGDKARLVERVAILEREKARLTADLMKVTAKPQPKPQPKPVPRPQARAAVIRAALDHFKQQAIAQDGPASAPIYGPMCDRLEATLLALPDRGLDGRRLTAFVAKVFALNARIPDASLDAPVVARMWEQHR